MDIQEKFLHHIWDQRHLISELFTVSGKSVKIVYQGQYNTSNGPDFKHAVLNLNGENLQGDVEIHGKTYDWTAHQHHEDRAYNETILHVVMEHKGNLNYTIREDSGQIEILELKDQIDTDIAKLFIRYIENPPVQHDNVCDLFQLTSEDQLLPLLKANGWERFSRKCGRFNAELHFNSFDQLLYNGFMEAMGYDKNKFNTLSLANHFNWILLTEWVKNGMDAITLAAIWLHYSGLMDRADKLLSPKMVSAIRTAFEYQSFTNDSGQLQWNLFRIRPANHPVKRILQASVIISGLLNKGFLNTVTSVMEKTHKDDHKQFYQSLRDALVPVENPYEEVEVIGNGMLSTIIGNIILPVIYLYSEKVNNTALQSRVKDLYYTFPPQSKNYISDFMQGYLNQAQSKLANATYINQQGMLNIYYRFCTYRLCDLCLSDKQRMMLNL